MKERCQQFYQSLLKDIDECRKKYSCLQKQIEHSFTICNQYWSILRNEITHHEFETLQEEICFFKQLKPLFTTEVEYYGLYYHAQLFKNGVYDPVKIEQFWTREASRLDKFIAEHRNFYEYYKAGETDKDKWYFTRTYLNNSSVNEPDARASSNHDHLISSLLALERYHEFVQTELQAMGK